MVAERSFTILWAALVAVAGSAHASERRLCAASANDEAAIRQIVHDFYEAERTGDSARWQALTTPDFTMFHEGVVTPPKAFAQWIDHQHAALARDKASSWTMDLSDVTVVVDCTTALTTQHLHNVSEAPTLKPGYRYDERFLESFWLRKAPGASWRIAFWNATKMPSATPDWAKVK